MNEKEEIDSTPSQMSCFRCEAERRWRDKKAEPIEAMAEVDVPQCR